MTGELQYRQVSNPDSVRTVTDEAPVRRLYLAIPLAFPLILVVLIVAVIIIALAVPSMMPDLIGWLLRGKPNDPEGWCYYGQLLAGRGRFVDAVEAFERALTLKSDYPEAWQRLGDVLAAMGQPDAAAEAYRHVDLGDANTEA
jgi:tetratricopeptide (TPR) repeat protein